MITALIGLLFFCWGVYCVYDLCRVAYHLCQLCGYADLPLLLAQETAVNVGYVKKIRPSFDGRIFLCVNLLCVNSTTENLLCSLGNTLIHCRVCVNGVSDLFCGDTQLFSKCYLT